MALEVSVQRDVSLSILLSMLSGAAFVVTEVFLLEGLAASAAELEMQRLRRDGLGLVSERRKAGGRKNVTHK